MAYNTRGRRYGYKSNSHSRGVRSYSRGRRNVTRARRSSGSSRSGGTVRLVIEQVAAQPAVTAGDLPFVRSVKDAQRSMF